MNDLQFIYTRSDGKHIYTRVTKSQAKRLFNAGREVCVVPVKCQPFGPIYQGAHLKNDYISCEGMTFDNIINEYIYYNCNYNELGRYPAYYMIDKMEG